MMINRKMEKAIYVKRLGYVDFNVYLCKDKVYLLLEYTQCYL